MPAKWQQDLDQARRFRSLIILWGNIRDLCPFSRSDDGSLELLELDDYLARWALRDFTSMQVYDPVDRFRTVFPTEGEAAESSAAPAVPASSESARLREGSAFPTTDVGAVAGIAADLARITEFLTEGDGRCCVIQFADRLAAARATDDERRDALVRLEKLVHDMRPGNRLIAVYLFAEDIPRELYVNEPRAVVIEIPTPERRDVHDVLQRTFGLLGEAADRAVNACHGLSLREIQRIAEELGGLADLDALEQATRRYKFGDVSNYWEELRLEKLSGAKEALKREIKGQDEAVDKVATALIRARADIQRTTGGKPGRPRGVLFFAGPTGVGKTLMAQKLQGFLFGDEDSLLRFDMSEYGQEFQVNRLYGAPPGYVGFEQGGALTSPVQADPFRVILFDEFEKADPRVFDIFLQILGDGRLTDSKGVVARFSESIIIFTSNIGADKESVDRLRSLGDDKERIRGHFISAVEDFFRTKNGRPELLNRIGRDNIVVFSPIDSETIALEILRQHLGTIVAAFNSSYAQRTPRLQLELDVESVAAMLLQQDLKRILEFGGREVENLVNERVRDELAYVVLEAQRLRLGTGRVRGVVAAGKLAFDLAGE